MIDKNYKKNFVWNSIGATINAFNSLFFLIVVTRINGLDSAGIFTFAFSVATLFNIVGIYSGRVYQVTDTEKNTYKDYFVCKLITCFIMFVLYSVFILIQKYSFEKSIILFILCSLKLFEAMAEYFYAYFQQEDKLYEVGISLTIKNFLMIGFFIIIDILFKNFLLSTTSLIVSYLIAVLIYDFRRFDFSLLKEKLVVNNLKNLFIKGFFTFCLTFLSFFIINLPRYIVDAKMTDEFNAIFGILIMPATVTLLLAQFFIQPSIIHLKKELKENNIKSFKNIIKKIFVIMLALGLIIIFVTNYLGIPVLNIVYGIKLYEYKTSLLVIMCGSIFYSLVVIMSNALITMRKTFEQVIIYMCAILISYFSSVWLISVNGIFGSALGYLITMVSLFVMFFILLLSSIKKLNRSM